MRQQPSDCRIVLQKSGRSPTVAELAEALDLSEEEILEGLSPQAYSTRSTPSGGA